MTYDAKLSVQAGLDHLAVRLEPIIAAELASVLNGRPWTVVLDQLDAVRGFSPRIHRRWDLQAQLKMLTRRLGTLGFPFDDHRQSVGTIGRELTIVRNARAHGDPFTLLDAWRAHDYCVRLLEYFADDEGLIRANLLRKEALAAYVQAEGISGAAPVSDPTPALEPTAVPAPDPGPGPGPEKTQAIALDHEPTSDPGDPESTLVTPDPEVFTREPTAAPTVVGNLRIEFEPWTPVPVGDISVLDDLPKVAAKLKVRAVAVEIVEAEGPIHVDRLAQLVAASFGVRKLHTARTRKIVRQVKSSGLVVDAAKFVWPQDLDPLTWTEFRPSSSEVDRPFLHISPVEVANAMRFLIDHHPDLSAGDLDTSTLRTFGRRRRTTLFLSHLARARDLLPHLATR